MSGRRHTILRRATLAALALVAQGLLALAHAAPTVSLTSPGDGWTYNAPANLPLRATATPDTGTTIARVEFYANGTLVGQDLTSAYAYNWNGIAAGTYALTAKAIDSTGAEATSAARTVTVSDTNQPPTVSLTAPANNATYVLPADITVTASASAVERNGSVTQVEFFANGVPIGSDTASPFSLTWSNPAPGTYTLTARATDNLGAQTTSAARTLTVTDSNTGPTVSLTAPANNAKYYLPASLTVTASASGVEANTPITQVELLDGATVLATLTAAPYTYAWANPPVGTHTLTARATDSLGAVTTSAARTVTITDTNAGPTVSLTAPANNAKYLAPADIALTASATGPETNTPVTLVEFLAGDQVLASLTAKPYSFVWANVPVGTHVLTARATDSLGAVTTSAARTVSISDTNLPPTVSLTAPANNAAFIAPATVTVTANAAAPEANGTVASVEFLANGSPIGSSTTKPYTLAWAVTAPGNYQLSARATDEQGAQTTSAIRTVTVLANQAPAISLTSPTANQGFTAPASIQLTAEASDPDNPLAKVEFFQGATLIATVLSPPYASTWENVTAGSYQITAKATDALGAETSTAPITISVANAQAGVFYLHTDHLNTPRLVTDEQNRIVWRNDPTTEPFGNSPVEEDPDGDGQAFTLNLRFPGQYADRETNTHYNYFRDYDPSTGRYVQSDPIGLLGGINTYTYVRNNPLNRKDPLGLFDEVPNVLGISGPGLSANPSYSEGQQATFSTITGMPPGPVTVRCEGDKLMQCWQDIPGTAYDALRCARGDKSACAIAVFSCLQIGSCSANSCSIQLK